jgi:hypothetical protein
MSLFYLINKDKKECFYLGNGNWDGIFPETTKRFPYFSDTFKLHDILPKHRLAKKSYIKFIDGIVRTNNDAFSYGNFDIEEILIAIQAWCGDHDIIFSRNFYAEDTFVLTGSANKEDRKGLFNHYIKKCQRLYRKVATAIFLTSIGVHRPFWLNLSRKIRGAK